MNAIKINTINVHELKKRYDETPDLCLIDVRENDEWETMHIPGAIHIPKDDITAIIDGKVPNFNSPIYLHCQGGVRSLHAAHYLADLGYQEVYSVDGGIMEWAASGYPVKS